MVEAIGDRSRALTLASPAQHLDGAAMGVHSKFGRGTAFQVLSPAKGISAGLLSAPDFGAPWTVSGLILVVGDDETVRAVARQALELKGFIKRPHGPRALTAKIQEATEA
jgi:hypothetical protein